MSLPLFFSLHLQQLLGFKDKYDAILSRALDHFLFQQAAAQVRCQCVLVLICAGV
jgi:hypothetical protein